MSSFHVDGRISIKLEYDLAVRIAEFILNSGTEDRQFLALAHKLAQIDEDDQQPPVKKKFYKEPPLVELAVFVRRIETNNEK